ncbi:MAG: transposase [Syntrophomonadaceae bacterium]|jgi:IS4 transposase|nr:transposase [Syntrophomonadaceae bacterium]
MWLLLEPPIANHRFKWWFAIGFYESDKILGLYRQRCQIEILCKRLKSLFHYDDVPAKTERTMKTFINGKLLLAAICEVLVSQGCFSPQQS